MGQDFKQVFQLETKRLLWFIATAFAVILAFQYLQLPYGNVLHPLSFTSKIPTSGNGSFQAPDQPSKSQIYDNMVNNTKNSEEMGTMPEEPVKESNMSSAFDEDDRSSVVDSIDKSDHESETESSYNITLGLNHLTNFSGAENITARSASNSGNQYVISPSPSPAIAPTAPTLPVGTPAQAKPNITVPENPSVTAPELSNNSNMSLVENKNVTNSIKDESFRPFKRDVSKPSKNSSISSIPRKNEDSRVSIPEAISISDMNNLLLQSRASYRSMRPLWSSAVDQEVLKARWEIENAPIVNDDPILYAPLYRNVSMFKRSYELMEQILKVYVYREGAKPILHSPFLRGIYASEGWFMRLMEANKKFVTKDAKKAHLFYLPFSSRMLEETLYVQNSHSHKNLVKYLNDYVDMIAGKHPFWNRTQGADHFLVACHDWAPSETRERMGKCIRALCNADVKEDFVLGKDVSLPETYIRNIQSPVRDVGGKPTSKRSTLAFFAGSMHGYVRPVLWQHWENKDPDMKIFENLPKSKGDKNYIQYMKSSKYCICAKGYEVNSPRVVEAILYECVPVIISDNFVPPFFEVLNWESFAVFVLEKDIPNLKDILLSIPRRRYLQMRLRVKKVQQHFLWHPMAVKYDIFHMILHSVWYNRVFTISDS